MIIKVRTKKEFETTVREYRENGYNIITFWKMYAEMEKGNEIVTIEK